MIESPDHQVGLAKGLHFGNVAQYKKGEGRYLHVYILAFQPTLNRDSARNKLPDDVYDQKIDHFVKKVNSQVMHS